MFWLDKLNQMKKKSGMTTDEISEKSKVPKGTLNKIFAGQTKDPQLGTIKAVVHCMVYIGRFGRRIGENRKSPHRYRCI